MLNLIFYFLLQFTYVTSMLEIVLYCVSNLLHAMTQNTSSPPCLYSQTLLLWVEFLE